MEALTPERLEKLAAAPFFENSRTEYRIEGLPSDVLQELGDCGEAQHCLVVAKE